MSTLREELDALDAKLFQLLSHPEATGQDKASIVLANTALSTIRERRKGRWPARAPKPVPQHRAAHGSRKGWVQDWEDKQEARHA